MDDHKILQGNKKFAEYLGYTYYGFKDAKYKPFGWKRQDVATHEKLTYSGFPCERNFLCRSHNDLKFFNDWNWLMEVVEKIESENFSVSLHSVVDYPTNTTIEIVGFSVNKGYLYECSINTKKLGITKKQAVWLACLEYLENTTNENPNNRS